MRLYEREFSKWRDEPIRLMEIGLNRGASLKVWLKYFAKAQVFGVDLDIARADQAKGVADDRLNLIVGDQSSHEFWKGFIERHPLPFEIIIDDGCHFAWHIAVSNGK